MNKRFFSVVVTLLCVILCAFRLAACDEDNSDKNEDGSGDAQTVAVKTVTSEQWEQAMESAEKFVIEIKSGEMMSAIKIDGDKRMQVLVMYRVCT